MHNEIDYIKVGNEKSASITQKTKYLFWFNVPYRVDVTDFSYIHLFFILQSFFRA